jgi:hypothetical protein
VVVGSHPLALGARGGLERRSVLTSVRLGPPAAGGAESCRARSAHEEGAAPVGERDAARLGRGAGCGEVRDALSVPGSHRPGWTREPDAGANRAVLSDRARERGNAYDPSAHDLGKSLVRIPALMFW